MRGVGIQVKKEMIDNGLSACRRRTYFMLSSGIIPKNHLYLVGTSVIDTGTRLVQEG